MSESFNILYSTSFFNDYCVWDIPLQFGENNFFFIREVNKN